MGEDLMSEYNKSFSVSGVYVVRYHADQLLSKIWMVLTPFVLALIRSPLALYFHSCWCFSH
jgi:hypothetical protein